MKKREICPICDGSSTYYRLKTDEYVCRVCGNIFKSSKKEEDKNGK